MEPSPQIKLVFGQGAKMLIFLGSKGVQGLKPEWEQTLAILKTFAGTRPALVAEFSV